MAQEYVLNAFEPSDFQDPHGNYWCSGVLQGVGEPVKMVVKDPMQFKPGMELYGTVKEVPTKKDPNKTYLRFFREKRPDDNQQSFGGTGKKEWQPRDDAAIRAQWAINQSREYIQHMLGKDAKLTEVLETAKLFFAMVEQVKDSVDAAPSPTTPEQGLSGYAQAKAQRQTLNAKKDTVADVPEDDAEAQSLIASAVSSAVDDGVPINLDDIPF